MLFNPADHISRVEISNFYGHRSTPIFMDDLYFTASVPEPGTLSLLLGGMIGVGFAGFRRRPESGVH